MVSRRAGHRRGTELLSVTPGSSHAAPKLVLTSVSIGLIARDGPVSPYRSRRSCIALPRSPCRAALAATASHHDPNPRATATWLVLELTAAFTDLNTAAGHAETLITIDHCTTTSTATSAAWSGISKPPSTTPPSPSATPCT